MFTDEEVIFITIIGTFIALFPSVILFIFFISYQKRKYKYAKEKQQLRTDFHQELLRAQVEIQEQTFQNISQEIHDNIGQMLSLVKLNLGMANVNDPKMAEEKIQRSREIVTKAIIDLRDLSKSLHPEAIMQMGLSEALQRELLVVARSGQYEVNLTQNGDPFRFDPNKEVIIFRIFQEILNNIIKHSQAATVNVILDYYYPIFRLTVIDDGEGFDAAKLESEETFVGIGVKNMHSRSKVIGAEFHLASTMNKGTTVVIELSTR
jgi:two-component system, NarL family, sensor kinase